MSSNVKRGKIRISDIIAKTIIWTAAIVAVAALAAIIIYILAKGLPHISWEFISTPYKGEQEGILPMIITTLYVILVTIIIATPIGIFAAIYLTQYAKQGRLLNFIRFATESLAGIPSIIYGLFGFLFFVNILQLKFSIIAGALTLSIMVLPTIIRTTEEAIKTVPISYKEGSLALGATLWTTIYKVILPTAIPGIMTAVILSIGRIVGETAAVYFTVGMVTRIPHAVSDSGRTLAVHLYLLAKEGISFEQSYATASILIIIVALINLCATIIAGKLKKKVTGKA